MSLAVQEFSLDLLPGKHPPHVKATQYDGGVDGWAFYANIRYGGNDYAIPEGYTATVKASLPSRNLGFEVNATISTDRKVVSFTLDDFVPAKGSWWCKIVFEKDGSSMASSGFVLDADPAGIDADDVINNRDFQQWVQEGVETALGETPIVSKNIVRAGMAAQRDSGTRRNFVCDGDTATLIYRDNESFGGVDYTLPFFRINLQEPIKAGESYILSFDCNGVGNQDIPAFALADDSHVATNDLEMASAPLISDNFELIDGHVEVHFTPNHDVTQFVRFREAPGAVRTVYDTEITVKNIQIVRGNFATDYQPSSETIYETAKEAKDLTHVYIEQATEEGWATAMFEGVHLMATTPLVVDNLHLLTEEEKAELFVTAPEKLQNFNVSEEIYIPYPFPNRYTFLLGGTDRGFMQLCNVNGIGARAPIAARFRLETPYYRAGTDLQKVTLRLFTSDRRHSIPRSPEYGYNADIASEIVAIARSYVAAQEAGRRFVYGGNIMYTETANKPRTTDGRITTADGYAIMECDTFVGMVLRGVDYAHSPYNPDYSFPNAESGWVFTPPDPSLPSGWVQNNDGSWTYHEPQVGTWTRSGEQNPTGTDPNREKNKRIIGTDGRTGYEQLMVNTASSAPIWSQKLRDRITSDVARKCYGRDMKYACDYAWMLWGVSTTAESNGHTKTIGCVFSDPLKAMPGDVAFFRKPDDKRWFDNISHCCIVTQAADSDGYVTIAEVTGANDSGGRVLQEVNMKQRSGDIAYFARPYGWYDPEETE